MADTTNEPRPGDKASDGAHIVHEASDPAAMPLANTGSGAVPVENDHAAGSGDFTPAGSRGQGLGAGKRRRQRS